MKHKLATLCKMCLAMLLSDMLWKEYLIHFLYLFLPILFASIKTKLIQLRGSLPF